MYSHFSAISSIQMITKSVFPVLISPFIQSSFPENYLKFNKLKTEFVTFSRKQLYLFTFPFLSVLSSAFQLPRPKTSRVLTILSPVLSIKKPNPTCSSAIANNYPFLTFSVPTSNSVQILIISYHEFCLSFLGTVLAFTLLFLQPIPLTNVQNSIPKKVFFFYTTPFSNTLC